MLDLMIAMVLAVAAPAPAAAPAQPRGEGPTEVRAAPPVTGARGLTRVQATVRPFISVLANGGGAIADFAIEHYFATLPLKLSLELAPLALAIEADGPGSIGHLRFGAAFSSRYIEFGAAVGTRFQNYGGHGISTAGFVRLGALDGLKLNVSYGYVLKRNRYTGKIVNGMSNVTGSFTVPLVDRLAAFVEGGVSSDRWIYTSLGLRHRLTGDGGRGTWFATGSLGVAWVIDRPECAYPDTGWCERSAWAAGPTLGLGLERRF